MEITKLLALLQVPQLGAQRIGRLLNEVDFAVFCNYDREQLRQIGWNEKQIQRWFNPDWRWIDSALGWAEKPQQHLISLFDVEYPFLLRQISTAPPILFVKGQTEVLSMPQIAMVGSRDYSHYGEYWSGYFASELVKNQIAVTSGLAIGIDGFCHQKALAENGITIAVLGSGLDQIYPSRHKKLAENIIAKGGALVSEFFPNQPPLAENFPRRNRIISGLSLGTLVVEATLNSGSLITARYALEQGREVFALPNSVQNPYSQGCHKLIKDGALLVESIDDILDAIAYQRQDSVINREIQPSLFTTEQAVSFHQKSATVSSKPSFAKKLPDLTASQQQLLDQIGLEPISIDDLAKVCGISIDHALVELLNLELFDVIKQVSGGYVRC
ncbi:DNA-protecting protein DprA [Ursidibacter maritimus]|uniref:DNA-protecting protein DprA n=1 Tax=Ursidibacter maritimus TaxID=1331689 RepID=A0A949T878_9PAST|nr:DNA-processing protein DprA [Ursidibacter maritimus]MBV6523471.1 DNA-protecting protein DprA [Ursidibacter maritimus]MBV6525844.1 DNA-protecting protein DprA [Ursidibacter maritimus]MBV6528184.1 DNA-protecting protein DprA [Ursidibacter maritimus]MBV6529315.1 DNA-protecting protein DprA [Ursidibacter maritimus]MBV6532161.1 DNA-protecting protein DprA [Ursidibacter maritimus]